MMYVELKKKDYLFIRENAKSFFKEYQGLQPIIEENVVLFPISSENEADKFETALNFSIVFDGMDNQDTLNDIGHRLYGIYDSYKLCED